MIVHLSMSDCITMTNKEKKICTTTQTACGSSDCRTVFPDGKFQEPLEKRSLLLHSCCGPCSTAVVERLAEEFNVTVFFYNPCITEEEEYQRRLQCADSVHREVQRRKYWENAESCTRKVITDRVVSMTRTKGHGIEIRKAVPGAECAFRQRLEKTAETASLSGHEYFRYDSHALALIRTTKLSPKSDAS